MEGTTTQVITATQLHPAASVPLIPRLSRTAKPIPSPRTPAPRRSVQPCLPGLENDAG